MLIFNEIKVAKEEFYGLKKPTNIWDVHVDNIVISKLVETKSNNKYLIRYLDKVIGPLVMALPNMLRHLKLTWR